MALLNSSLWEWRFRLTSTNNHVNSYEIDSMPMPRISFTTPEQERKERVDEAIELYKSYMVDFERGYLHEKAEDTVKYNRALEREPDPGRKEEVVSGEHPRSGKLLHGLRGRTRKPKDAEKVSDSTEEV